MTTSADELQLSTLLPVLESRLPQMVTEITELLQSDFPDYALELAADEPDSLEMAQLALRHLVELAETVPQRSSARADDLATPALFEDVGRTEWREGRELGVLLSAYRAGGRVAWRHISEVAVARALPPAAVATLAEAVFLFIEELSSATARGYVEEQRATAAERERLRAQLAELLVSGRSDVSVMRAVALRAGWPVPAAAAIVLVDPADEAATTGLGRLEGSSLPLRTGTLAGAIVVDPDAPGRRHRLVNSLAGCGAVVGPTVSLEQLPASLRITEAALRLALSGAISGDPVFVAEHYDAILVGRDGWLLAQLREQMLAPLDGLPESTRTRLEETLAAWLAAAGDRRVAAGLLRVHPQTVRYRLRQLDDRFGAALTDPQARLKLTLALCWPPAKPRNPQPR